jgi:hypothetical protein
MTERADQQLLWERLLIGWVPVVVVSISVAVGIWTWHRNAAAERAQQDYVRREQRYSALVSSLKGFQIAGSSENRAEFLAQLNQCWLYCSDPVIRAAYRFVGTVETGAGTGDEARRTAAGELVAAIRRDLIRRQPVLATDLSSSEYRILRVQ